MNDKHPEEQKTILCVDDEVNILNSLKRLLHKLPYNIIATSKGDEALTLVKELEPDLILLDVFMDGINGFEVLEKINQLELKKRPHVVFLTGANDVSDLLNGYEKGACYYITKPFRNEYVINIVNYMIGDLSVKEKSRLELNL